MMPLGSHAKSLAPSLGKLARNVYFQIRAARPLLYEVKRVFWRGFAFFLLLALRLVVFDGHW
jgi:hypothetical protein